MKTLATILACAAMLSSGPAFAKGPDGETKLAQMIEGRVAGQPMRCIAVFRDNGLKVIDRVGVAYEAGDTIWVARAANPETVRDRDVLIVDRTSGGQLCRDDVRRTIDPYQGALKSVVFLEDFVPYTRAG